MLVGDRIEYGLREFSWSGEQAERFNAITRAYYMKAAATQFPLPEGMNLPLTLRHYRVFISYCSPSKKKSRADILEMENLVKNHPGVVTGGQYRHTDGGCTGLYRILSGR